jgi:hypothetical protein
MQQLSVAAAHLLKMRRRMLLLPNSITAYRHEQLRSSCLRVLQRVAAAAMAQFRLVPWIDLLADQLTQQLKALSAAEQEDQEHRLQTRQQQQQAPAALGRLPLAALQDWTSDDDDYCDAQQLPVTSADSAASCHWPGAAEAAAQQPHSNHTKGASSGDRDDMPSGVTLVGTWDDELVQQLLSADEVFEEHQDAKAAAEIVLLLQCLQPLGTCRKGLLALVPHVKLLQEAAAALQQQPAPSKRPCAVRQDVMMRWAAHTAAATLAALSDTQQEHALACVHLRCEINHTASTCSAAAAGNRNHQQQQQQQQQQGQQQRQQQAEVLVAIDRLAVASSWLEDTEQLLQLAGAWPAPVDL